MKKINKITGLCGILTALSFTASANTITPGLTVAPGFIPGVSITYRADLTSGELHSGDGFTIFDIGGFTGFGVLPAFWTATSSAFGSPWGVAPVGIDTSDMNVTFTYTGSPVEVSSGSTLYVPFTVLTTSMLLVTDDWTSRDHLLGIAGVIDGTPGRPHADEILVPAHVPDGGSTLALLGLAFAGIGLIRRKLVA